MGFGAAAAAGTGGVNNNQSLQGNQNAFQELNDALIESTKTFDTEAYGVANSTKDAKGGVNEQYGNTATQEQSPTEQAQQLMTAASDMMTEEADKKKKLLDKKNKFEQKLETLGKLESLIDEKQVDGEDKGVIQEFFDNMSRIKNLRGRLRQLEQEEDYLEQKQEQQQHQKQQQQKQEEREKNSDQQEGENPPYYRRPF